MSVYGGIKDGGEKNDLLHEPAFVEMIEREICDGQHIRPENSAYHGMTRSFFHHPDELEKEITSAGFIDIDLRGVVGCGWIAPDLDDAWKDPVRRESILHVVRLLEKEKSLMGFSTHLLAIAQKATFTSKT